MSAVYGVIRKLGATSKYKGYYYVVDAVEMAQKIYERPVKVTKDIYPVIARKYKFCSILEEKNSAAFNFAFQQILPCGLFNH